MQAVGSRAPAWWGCAQPCLKYLCAAVVSAVGWWRALLHKRDRAAAAAASSHSRSNTTAAGRTTSPVCQWQETPPPCMTMLSVVAGRAPQHACTWGSARACAARRPDVACWCLQSHRSQRTRTAASGHAPQRRLGHARCTTRGRVRGHLQARGGGRQDAQDAGWCAQRAQGGSSGGPARTARRGPVNARAVRSCATLAPKRVYQHACHTRASVRVTSCAPSRAAALCCARRAALQVVPSAAACVRARAEPSLPHALRIRRGA